MLFRSALCFLGAGSGSGISFTAGLSQSRGLFGDLIDDSAVRGKG